MFADGEITEDTIEPFMAAECIELYDIDELPEIRDIMRDNLLPIMAPAHNVADEGYNEMVQAFSKNGYKIAKADDGNTTTYMLIY